MPFKPKIKQPKYITVENFARSAGESLKMELVGSDIGFKREIQEPSVNRPGLALAGFFDYFAYKRVQVMGNSELSYMKKLTAEERREHYRLLCQTDIPCIVVARGRGVPDDLLPIANAAGISVFHTQMVTMKFLNQATLKLDFLFSPTTTLHGCMVDVQGIGILIQGPSGSGKSEAVIGLLQRGASIVADDKVNLRLNEEREIIATADPLALGMIEVRGLGCLDVSRLYGVGSIRLAKRLDLIVHLQPGAVSDDVERLGFETQSEELLGLPIPSVTLPITPGRDTSGLIHLAALHKKLHAFGINSAQEFNQRLLKKLTDNQLG
jgi:HPr kinase/phosphorylase